MIDRRCGPGPGRVPRRPNLHSLGERRAPGLDSRPARAWRNGRRGGLKIRSRKTCRFESDRPHHCPARALGARFDIRDYNDAVVTTGGSPLAVLETVVGRYIAETLKA